MNKILMSGFAGAFCVILLSLTAGCEQTRIHRSLNNQDVTVVDYSTDRRGTYIVTKQSDKSPVYIISEPSPDTAREYKSAIEASLNGLEGVDGSAKVELSQNVIDLAKRSQTLQIQREALYRLNVLLANGSITEEDAASLYLQVLKSIQVIALAELANSDLPAETKARVVDEAAEHLFKDVISGGFTDPEPGTE